MGGYRFMDVNVRYSKPKDFNAILSLFDQLWPDKELDSYNLEEVFNRGVESNSDEYICAEADGKVIGFCALSIVNNFSYEGLVSYIYAMIVDDSFRGRGVGTSLLEKALDISKSSGCKRIELNYDSLMEESSDFYKKIGFEEKSYLFSKDLH